MVNKKNEAITTEVVTLAMNRVLTDLESKIQYTYESVLHYTQELQDLSQAEERDEWKIATYERYVMNGTSEMALMRHLIKEMCDLSINKAKKIVEDSI
jgi:hypothetical protein